MVDIIKRYSFANPDWINDPDLKQEAGDKLIEMVRENNERALFFILNRITPSARNGITLPFELPIVNNIHELNEAENRITKALNEKKITITEANELFQMFNKKRETITVRDCIIKVEDMIENALDKK